MPLTYHPFDEVPAVQELAKKLRRNVPDTERAITVFAGVLMIARALSQRGVTSLPLLGAGAALIGRGWTGHCPLYEEMEVRSRLNEAAHGG